MPIKNYLQISSRSLYSLLNDFLVYTASVLKYIPAAILISVINPVYAGPEGGKIVGGSGTVRQNGNATIIDQNSSSMAIDWQSYNVNANERVQYIQPDSSSVSLNRILSNQGSQIHGQIDANGHVILVNPHGVVFGENATVNVGAILTAASTGRDK